MFYYLLNHSSLLNKQNEKAKNLSIILFGSLIYLSIHAFLSFNKNTTIQKVKPYFWFMFLLDIVMSYYSFIHNSKDDNNDESLDNNKEHNFMEEIFSIKNKISNMISSNKTESYQQENENKNNKNNNNNNEKSDLQKEKDDLILKLKEELNNSKNNNSEHTQTIENKEDINKEKTITSSKKLSTSIKNLKKNKLKIQQKQELSNNDIENQVNNEEDNIKTTNKEEITFNDSASESGSEMDFDISEFQNSLDE
jgi:hypothetical protein